MPRGFTLVELLLYVALASAILLAVSGFLAILLQAQVKGNTILEVDGQGLYVMETITRAVREAEEIAVDSRTSSTTLALTVLAEQNNPTVFSVSDDVLYVAEGENGESFALTNERVRVVGFMLSYSSPAFPNAVRIELTLSHVNPLGRNEYAYEKTFITTATLR